MDANKFSCFVDLCEKIRSSTSKNEKVSILSAYISILDESSLPIVVLFLSGNIFPKGSRLNLNLGFSTIMHSLSEIAILEPKEIQQIYLKHGDMGALTEYAVSRKYIIPLLQQQEQLTLSNVYARLKKIASATGSGSGKNKTKILKGLLISCSPIEAKYLVKIINSEMRIGLVEGLIELAIAKAFACNIKDVREAMLLSADISYVSILAKNGSLRTTIIGPLTPFGFMLADTMFTVEEIANYYQKPLICEYNYDGIRVQMHKSKGVIRAFSRKLDDITSTFPELVNAAATSTSSLTSSSDCDFILDGEILAFKNDRPLLFQHLQKRLHKKNVTKKIIDEIPVIYAVYDILYFGEEQVIKKPLIQRKQILSNIQFKKPIINASYKIVHLVEEMAAMFAESRNKGHEGLILKDPDSQYQLGKRGRYWMKLKTELDTIDAVIVMAEYGHGKRAGTLSDYTFAVRDDSNNSKLRTIGKAYSGLSNEEIGEMTTKLRSIVMKDEGSRLIVNPEIVLEIAFDSIQKSERYDSGFAFRFPRIKYIRSDKTINDIDTLAKVNQIYQRQVHSVDK